MDTVAPLYEKISVYRLLRSDCLLQLLKYKDEFIELLQLLIDKTKSERGYSGTGRLIHRILHTIAGVYPINTRFVNSDEWDDPGAFVAPMAVIRC